MESGTNERKLTSLKQEEDNTIPYAITNSQGLEDTTR
jgi:hypothetical protein